MAMKSLLVSQVTVSRMYRRVLLEADQKNQPNFFLLLVNQTSKGLLKNGQMPTNSRQRLRPLRAVCLHSILALRSGGLSVRPLGVHYL